jgi:hypothetical protein
MSAPNNNQQPQQGSSSSSGSGNPPMGPENAAGAQVPFPAAPTWAGYAPQRSMSLESQSQRDRGFSAASAFSLGLGGNFEVEVVLDGSAGGEWR